MKKLQLPFGSYYYERFMQPVRKKKDSIFLILDIINLLLIREEITSPKGTIMIVVDKMSRLFSFTSDKYFSMVFPFEIELTDESNNYKIYDSVLNMEINNRLVVLMERMLDSINFTENTIDEIIESAYFDVAEEFDETEVGNCLNLILRLLSMELGYVRYDFDLAHENGAIHPLYHLDVNYSSKGTYKLGLQKKMQQEEFVNLLDIKTECRYIV